MHGQQGRGLGRVPEIVGKGPSGHGWTRGGLGCDNGDILAVDLVPHIREAYATKIAAATGAAQNHIRIHAN